MADYYPLISGAVAKLPENTPASRRALYERVRSMLAKQLQSANPTISEAEVGRERRALDEAIKRVEAEAGTPAPAAQLTGAPKVARPARANGARRVTVGIAAIIVVAIIAASAYYVYARLLSRTSAPAVAAVPAGDDAIAIRGLLAGYRGAADKQTDVLLLHVRCGATVVERDAESNPANPSGHLDDQGRFSITVKKTYLGDIIKVGVRASTAPADELHQDFLTLGFFTGDKLALLAGADGKTIKISPQGQILNAGAVNITSVVSPPLIVARKPDGNIYAGGGAFVFDGAC